MLAVVFDGKVHLRPDWPEPTVGPSEALVAVRTVGICRTDLEILKGYMDFSGVIGHEFVGVVLQGADRWAGKRVVAEINCACEHCEVCRRGLGNHCPNRTVVGIAGRDGAMAEKLVVPTANLHEAPQNVSDDQAVFVEPLAAAFEIPAQVEVSGADVVVLDDGRLGQLAARVLKGRAANVLLVGKHPGKLAAARNYGIATQTTDQFIPAQAAEVVVEATGCAEGFQLAMQSVRPRGTIALKSTYAAPAGGPGQGGGVDLAPLVINEVTVVGSRCGPFPQAIAALESGEVEITDLISRRFPLREALKALNEAELPRNIKILIDVQ
jgi:threonine dehydrogenase-like Zn-dependent dehydrogenase